MAISLKKIDGIKNGALITVQNIMPFRVTATSSYNTTVSVSIYNCANYSDISSGNKVTDNLEMLMIEKRGNIGTYAVEVGNIIRSCFEGEIDDTLQSNEEWIDMDEMLKDFVIVFTATNGTDSDASTYIEFTAFNISTQFGFSSVLVQTSDMDATSSEIISTADRKLNRNETIYCQAGNVCYIYAITSDDGSIIDEAYDEDRYFIDSDGLYLTDYDDSFFKELIQ